MKKEGSTASMLWLDIRRGFCSKRFWGIVGVVTIVFVVFLTLDIIYPLQKYYNGYGTFDWKLDSISMAPFAVRIGILSRIQPLVSTPTRMVVSSRRRRTDRLRRPPFMPVVML